MVGIYKITNLINKKIYIGQSINIEKRWQAHRTRPFNKNDSQYDSPLYRSIRFYGLNNFSFEVLEECEKEELNDREIFYIDYFQSFNNEKGYNLTKGGYSPPLNSKISDSDLKQIYDLLIYSTLSEEEIAKKFNVSQRYISGINLGEYKIQTNYTYPLRKEKIIKIQKYFCIDCGKEISSNKAKRCVNCANKFQRKVERPNRESLKNEIRTQSFLSLSKKYGVSDTAIRKWCKQYNLPFKKTDIKKFSDKEWSKI